MAAVSRVLNAIPPPPKLAETEDGPSRGPFFFWFQKGLVMATALWRLSKRSKSVSKQHLSLIDRPRPPEGRFQNTVQLQMLGDFGRAPFSKVQAVSKLGFEQKRRLLYGASFAQRSIASDMFVTLG